MGAPHVMALEQTYPSGADEWYCPICGRRVVLRMPQYKKMILEEGDEEAQHEMIKLPPPDFDWSAAAEQARLEEPFKKWLDEQRGG